MNQKPARRKKFEHAPPANWRLRLGRCNHRRRALYAVDRPAIDFAAKAANVRLASIVLKNSNFSVDRNSEGRRRA
jgi:hypothetical protein